MPYGILLPYTQPITSLSRRLSTPLMTIICMHIKEAKTSLLRRNNGKKDNPFLIKIILVKWDNHALVMADEVLAILHLLKLLQCIYSIRSP